jgi:hypothetical protein
MKFPHHRRTLHLNGNNAPDNEASAENKGLQPLVLERADGLFFVFLTILLTVGANNYSPLPQPLKQPTFHLPIPSQQGYNP